METPALETYLLWKISRRLPEAQKFQVSLVILSSRVGRFEPWFELVIRMIRLFVSLA